MPQSAFGFFSMINCMYAIRCISSAIKYLKNPHPRQIAKKMKILMFEVSVFIVNDIYEKAMCQNKQK